MAKALTPHETLEKAYFSILKFPEGVLIMKHILDITGYNAPDLMTYNPATSELNINASIYNLSKRDVWVKIKEFLTPEQQAYIEKTEIQQLVKSGEQPVITQEEREDA
jgi:hypothetical protein